MSSSRVFSFLALCGLCFVFGAAEALSDNGFQDHQRKVGLIIGVGDYSHVPALSNPENDARDVGESLNRLGFELIVALNPDRAALLDSIARFKNLVRNSDIAVLYYAGHSIQVDNQNFVIPTDALLRKPDDVENFLLPISDLSRVMEEEAAVKIVILDACRDNPFLTSATKIVSEAGGGQTIGRGLAAFPEPLALERVRPEQAYGSVIAYAAAPGRTASDGVDNNSPYTAALLEYLEEPGLEIGQMFRKVASKVLMASNGQQRPEYLVRLTDEVYFRVPEPTRCDFLAAAPYNAIGVRGVDFERIAFRDAIPACEEALRSDPSHPRLLFNLGRSHDAAGNFKEAIAYYRESSALDYPAATSSLGVMHINGQGVPQDFIEGTRLLKIARSLGSRTAKISLSYSDFSVLFERNEFRQVQRKLKELGYYKGSLDGDFGQASERALEKFQRASRLRLSGLTLETLDQLELVEIIPNYELN